MSTPYLRPHALWLLPAACLLGCPSNHHARSLDTSFASTCLAGDASCDTPGTQVSVPDRVAIGSALQLAYTGEQVTDSPVSARPVSPHMALVDGLSIRFTAKGYCGILARSEAGTVVDLLHIQALPIHTITIVGPPTIEPSASTSLAAVPRDDQDNLLAGSLSYTWSTSDPSVAAIDTSAHGNTVKVLGVGPGTATIKTVTGATEASFALTVSEAP